MPKKRLLLKERLNFTRQKFTFYVSLKTSDRFFFFLSVNYKNITNEHYKTYATQFLILNNNFNSGERKMKNYTDNFYCTP